MARKETDGGSLLARAILALSLMVGFYLLALGIVVGLAIAVLQVNSSQPIGVSWRLFILAALAIYAIVRGIIPRRQKFVEPGPRLAPDEQPELFEEIRRTAEATDSAIPEDVYLAPDVNAAVAHVGGVLGIGARPIIILGLPLIAVLNVSELRGVIAHEFGHYVGGETKLAPLIYRTRDAIARTVFGLATSTQGFQQLLSFPSSGTGVCTCARPRPSPDGRSWTPTGWPRGSPEEHRWRAGSSRSTPRGSRSVPT